MTFSRDIVCEIIKFEHKTCKLTTNLWLCLLFMNIHYLIPKFDWLITDTPGTPPPSSIIAHIPFHPFHNISFSGINMLKVYAVCFCTNQRDLVITYLGGINGEWKRGRKKILFRIKLPYIEQIIHCFLRLGKFRRFI